MIVRGVSNTIDYHVPFDQALHWLISKVIVIESGGHEKKTTEDWECEEMVVTLPVNEDWGVVEC